MSQDQIYLAARVAHAANRAYCIGLGDTSQPEWDEAPEWQQESAIKGVKAILRNPTNATPEQSHMSWMAIKLAEGWSWGPEKRPDLLEHPCMVPYHSLPVEQQVKDHIFIATVKAVLNV